MKNKTGFTTGTLSGDLDAKFGANRSKVAPNLAVGLVVSFGAVQILAAVLTVLLFFPGVWFVFAFLSEHPDFISTLHASLKALI